jgi:hypothetical protein
MRQREAGHHRARIAQVAARLIAEHGISDWTAAKRKAARQLMLPEREALPGDDEIQAALVDHQMLFGGDAYRQRLRNQREEALVWMRRLATFNPQLTGGVAAGWATDWSDIRLDLAADDAKQVEMTLLGSGIAYRCLPADRDGAAELFIDTPRGGVRLCVRSREELRQRPRHDRHGQPTLHLDEAALVALLD